MLEISSLEVLEIPPISLTVDDGECVVIRGASGSGKSMFLRAVADLDVSKGDVFLDEVPRSSMAGPQWRKQVRYVSAEPGWWAEKPLNHFSDAEYARVSAEKLGLVEETLVRPVSYLSTGERQRLALARALEDRPRVVLLDEPTGALDGLATARVESVIKEELERGASVIVVSHDEDQGVRFAGRSYEMSVVGLRAMT